MVKAKDVKVGDKIILDCSYTPQSDMQECEVLSIDHRNVEPFSGVKGEFYSFNVRTDNNTEFVTFWFKPEDIL